MSTGLGGSWSWRRLGFRLRHADLRLPYGKLEIGGVQCCQALALLDRLADLDQHPETTPVAAKVDRSRSGSTPRSHLPWPICCPGARAPPAITVCALPLEKLLVAEIAPAAINAG